MSAQLPTLGDPLARRPVIAAAGKTGATDAVHVFGFKRRSLTAARRVVTGLLAVLAFGALGAAAASADSLYIGDQTDNTIQSFDATGNPLGTFIPAPTGVIGPRGILHLSNGHFLVAYQNPGQPFPGEIDQFAQNGVSLGPLVPSSNPNAPFAPRGIILGPDGRTLYVADFGAGNIGAVERYDVVTGQFLGDLTFDSFINSSASNGEFHPRGLPVAMISERK